MSGSAGRMKVSRINEETGMPKIEVNEELFYTLVGKRWNSIEAFEEALTCAKAELDEDSDKALPMEDRTLKIELNDTNRPDLWSTAGCARQLRIHGGGKRPEYHFFSSPGNMKDAKKKVIVEETVKFVRPYLAGFIASGKSITDASLKDMIQTQEKLAWNFGRKRRSVSMGIYRMSEIKWPIIYKGADPDSVSFVPLQWEGKLTLREILKQHPKGKEYAFIQEHEKIHPLLLDSRGEILSYPPIINSASLGAVQVGDTDVFVEITGTDLPSVTLAASIMSCDLADQGYTIEPVEVEYAYDTLFGKRITFPFYFQNPIFCSLDRIEKFLGMPLNAKECVAAMERVGCRAEKQLGTERSERSEKTGILVYPPEYRNDFLHAADVVEDVMIGRTLASFEPLTPKDFTIGRLTPITMFSRRVKEIMVGLGYQEMIFNYLGSRKNLVENMRGDGGRIIRISNPMTENYEYVRDSVLASLMMSESVSGHAVYPHKIFEIGKVAYQDKDENNGTQTHQYLGFIHAAADTNFNTLASQMQTLFYYLGREYEVEASGDSRFIPGRAAMILYQGTKVGVFGEIHPEVLENWGITMPCTALEMDLDLLMG